MKKNEQIISAITDFLTNEYQISDKKVMLTMPKQKQNGDWSTTIALQIKNLVDDDVQVIAKKIADYVAQNVQLDKVTIAGPGFINFFTKENAFSELLEKYKDSELISFDDLKGQNVNIEYVSANPTGKLHLGHARNAAIGSALVNIAKALGANTQSEYWINDQGSQINKSAMSVFIRYLQLCDVDVNLPEDAYHGQDVILIAKQIEQKYQASLKDLSIEDGSAKIKDEVLKLYLAMVDESLQAFNVKIEKWTSEREFYANGSVKKALEILDQKGLTYEKDGAKWFKSTNYGDDKDRVLIKQDGAPTYIVGDIALHLDKYQRDFDRYINVWGADHYGYIARIKGIISAFDYDADKLDISLMQLVHIVDDEGNKMKMSKRSGNSITLEELTQLIDFETVRYFFLAKPTNSHLEFNLEQAQKQSSDNPIYYIQYASARINSVFEKFNALGISLDDINYNLLDKDDLEILNEVSKYHHVLKRAYETLEPNKVCNYAYALAAKFHTFYNKVKFINEADLEKTKAYMSLLKTVQVTLKSSLDVLGIEAKIKM